MRRLVLLCALLTIPSITFAQTPPPANKEAVLLQLIDDMKQGRAVIHPSEVEAAGCKVQLKQVQSEIDTLKKATEKPVEKDKK